MTVGRHQRRQAPVDVVVSRRLKTAPLVTRTFEPRGADPSVAMFNDPEARRFVP